MGWRLWDGAAGVAVNVGSTVGPEAVADTVAVSVATSTTGDGNSSTVSGVAPELWDQQEKIKRTTIMTRIETVTWKIRSRNFRLPLFQLH
ncbi:MAG: hypothetical protein IH861_07630 [Chloroflexi bacterium]|nr:hypothetical protein [Chloroflexota bacterium]